MAKISGQKLGHFHLGVYSLLCPAVWTLMALCWAILRGQQIYTVIQAVHSLLYIVAKCHFSSVVTWKYIIKYFQKCEGVLTSVRYCMYVWFLQQCLDGWVRIWHKQHESMDPSWLLLAWYRAMSQSSNHLRLVSWTWQWVHYNRMPSTVTRSQSSSTFGMWWNGRFTSGWAAHSLWKM